MYGASFSTAPAAGGGPQRGAYMSRPGLYGGFGGGGGGGGGGFASEAPTFQEQQPQRLQSAYAASYGAAEAVDLGGAVGKASHFFARAQRQRLNVIPMCQCFLVPWLFFCLVYSIVSFELHYTSPGLCWTLAGVCLAGVLVLCGLAALGAWRKRAALSSGLYSADAEVAAARPPSWLTFLALSLLAAWIMGVLLGNLNFWANMQPYYDYNNLNSHASIDPARTRGREFMDAGRVEFTNNSALDLRKSMGFRNLDTYCVAPISVKSPDTGVLLSLDSYDYWAVGLDCCKTHAADFHCGDFSNPKARQGLRLLRDDQRPFFRLAVQQAEATYSIKSSHPLFFYWVADATAEMESYRDDGYKYYLIGMLSHFAWQLLCVTLAAAAFARMGKL